MRLLEARTLQAIRSRCRSRDLRLTMPPAAPRDLQPETNRSRPRPSAMAIREVMTCGRTRQLCPTQTVNIGFNIFLQELWAFMAFSTLQSLTISLWAAGEAAIFSHQALESPRLPSLLLDQRQELSRHFDPFLRAPQSQHRFLGLPLAP